MKEKKKYYSPVKDYDTFKRPHLFFKLLTACIRLFFPKTELEYRAEKPADDGTTVYVCNHTKIFAPSYFILYHPELRLWQNNYFLYFSTCWHHMKTRVLNTRKPKFILYPLGFLLTPIIVLICRAYDPIPVFHTPREAFGMTFKKAVESSKADVPQLVFPERTENKVNRYIYQINTGFTRAAELFYKETGKKIKYYPVYCAQPLRKVIVGEPIEYDPTIPMAKQKRIIGDYLENAIQELGDSLPEHEPVIYG